MLRTWLASPPTTVQFFIEPFLRVHLARFGTLDQLRAAVAAAETSADELLQVAVDVAAEFTAGEHLFQDELPVRALLFDGLWAQGIALKEWSVHARDELDRWNDVDGDDAARRRARTRMRRALEAAEAFGITPTAPDPAA